MVCFTPDLITCVLDILYIHAIIHPILSVAAGFPSFLPPFAVVVVC